MSTISLSPFSTNNYAQKYSQKEIILTYIFVYYRFFFLFAESFQLKYLSKYISISNKSFELKWKMCIEWIRSRVDVTMVDIKNYYNKILISVKILFTNKDDN